MKNVGAAKTLYILPALQEVSERAQGHAHGSRKLLDTKRTDGIILVKLDWIGK
jgi:hypothetical protein